MKTYLIGAAISLFLHNPLRSMVAALGGLFVIAMLLPKEQAQSLLAVVFILGMVTAFFVAESKRSDG